MDESQFQPSNDIVIPIFKDIDVATLNNSSLHPAQTQTLYKPGGLETIQIGTGDTVFNVDSQGFWMGAARFSRAPIRATMSGKLVANLVTENEEVIADEIGLNSLNNFIPNAISQAADQTFTDVTWVAASGLVLSLPPIGRYVMALVNVSVSGYHDDVDGRLEFRVMLNAIQVGSTIVVNRVAAAGTIQTEQITFPILLSPGINGLVIEGRSNNANSGVLKGSELPAVLGCLLLGK